MCLTLAKFPAESGLVGSFLGVRMSFIAKLWTTLITSDNFHVEEIF